jgi:hypothetical protein
MCRLRRTGKTDSRSHVVQATTCSRKNPARVSGGTRAGTPVYPIRLSQDDSNAHFQCVHAGMRRKHLIRPFDTKAPSISDPVIHSPTKEEPVFCLRSKEEGVTSQYERRSLTLPVEGVDHTRRKDAELTPSMLKHTSLSTRTKMSNLNCIESP